MTDEYEDEDWEDEEEFLTTQAEIAERYGVSTTTTANWLRKSFFPDGPPYSISEIDRFLHQIKSPAAPQAKAGPLEQFIQEMLRDGRGLYEMASDYAHETVKTDRYERYRVVTEEFHILAWREMTTLFQAMLKKAPKAARPALIQSWTTKVAELRQQFTALVKAIDEAEPNSNGWIEGDFEELFPPLEQANQAAAGQAGQPSKYFPK